MQTMHHHRHGRPAGALVISSRATKPAYAATFKAIWSTPTDLMTDVFWTIHQRPRGATS